MAGSETYISQSISHIRFLSESIGGRGSCSAQVQRTSKYLAAQLEILGVSTVHSESFKAIPSTYQPYALSFGVALLGSLIALIFGNRYDLALATLLNALGFWGMLAETDFVSSWIRWILPKAESQNVIGIVSPAAEVRRRVVLNAHMDTHRTPIFYSSRKWHTLFSVLVGLTLLSMALGAAGFGVSAVFNWNWMHWISLILIPVQAFALALCLHAEITPFTPGANDNASGVGVIMGLAARLIENPLDHTEVNLVFTDCEESGAYGIQAYLDAHSAELGEEAVYVILDEVGNGTLKYLTEDGLILKHRTHKLALELAQAASTLCPDIKVYKGPGIAYTDALPATKRGLISLTLCTLPKKGSGNESHWHQMSDTFEHVVPGDLGNTQQFTWQILKLIDSRTGEERIPLNA